MREVITLLGLRMLRGAPVGCMRRVYTYLLTCPRFGWEIVSGHSAEVFDHRVALWAFGCNGVMVKAFFHLVRDLVEILKGFRSRAVRVIF